MLGIPALISAVSGILSTGLGVWQKRTENKDAHNQQLDLLALHHKYALELAEKNITLSQQATLQSLEETKKAQEGTEQAFLQFAEKTSHYEEGHGWMANTVMFCNGMIRPLITLVGFLGLLIFVGLGVFSDNFTTEEVRFEIIFIYIEMIVAIVGYWFGVKIATPPLKSIAKKKMI